MPELLTELCSVKFPQKVFAGAGSINGLGELQTEKKWRRVLVLTDQGVKKAGILRAALDVLENAVVIDDLSPEPTIGQAYSLCERLSHVDADGIVALGGGSVLDVGKLLAAAYTNPAYRRDLENTLLITNPPLPSVAIPTSSGTGAEATANAIFLFPDRKLKIGIISDAFMYRYVFLDPELTVGLPAPLTAFTGLDALCHALESYLSTLNSPLNELYAFEAMRLIGRCLEAACRNGADLEARYGMQLAAFYAGICLTTSSTTAIHALSYPLGGKYHIPHGLSNAILLPHVMRTNLGCADEKFAKAADLMLPHANTMAEQEKPEAFVRYLFQLTLRLEIPQKLHAFGITRDSLDELADNAVTVERLLSKNPRALTRGEIRGIYEKLL